MKAIILAAGRGSRLGKYTKEIPKGLLKVSGKTILDIQIENYRRIGIDDISIVKGYNGEKINIDGVKYYWNRDFDNTNMVVSLMKATPEFDDDIIVSYADILFEPKLLNQIIEAKGNVTVLVDDNWEKYWLMRYGTINFDLESLVLDGFENIIEIGRPILSKETMHARFIGVLKFSKQGIQDAMRVAMNASKTYQNIPWKHSGKPYFKAYMTDLLQALIDTGINIKAQKVHNGWLEFDTENDYENALSWISSGCINALFEDYSALINNKFRRKIQ